MNIDNINFAISDRYIFRDISGLPLKHGDYIYVIYTNPSIEKSNALEGFGIIEYCLFNILNDDSIRLSNIENKEDLQPGIMLHIYSKQNLPYMTYSQYSSSFLNTFYLDSQIYIPANLNRFNKNDYTKQINSDDTRLPLLVLNKDNIRARVNDEIFSLFRYVKKQILTSNKDKNKIYDSIK